ncbi:MAG TPA: restriction endonuclease [Terriglobia bacterium]|nr:restriction endonuclease [Terriglobia bacterium]
MTRNCNPPASFYVENIRKSGRTIYDPVEVGDPNLWIPTPALESLLDTALVGLDLARLPNRTRSKVVKKAVCKALGYPVPASFTKTRPRFKGQLFDTYTQKSNNLQVWNEELSPSRRYVVIRPDSAGIVRRVKVVTGDALAKLETTGTLTQKYQARLICRKDKAELVSSEDTPTVRLLASPRVKLGGISPTDNPSAGALLPIAVLFRRLLPLVGVSFPDSGRDQERRRGADVHRLVCNALGYSTYADVGQFPDVRHQLLEVKLQTAPTIDLGLVRPDSQEPLDVPKVLDQQLKRCDVRYVLFYAKTDGRTVTLTHIYLTTGEAFFGRFPQFRGRVLNRKLQVPLPKNFFD